jgi:predicted amidophosphoribosyltransferase
MASAAEYTDPYLHTYTPVPAAGLGVCVVCHSGPNAGYDTCYSCTAVRQQVSRPTRTVVPISLYALNSQMWHVLRNYKDGTGPSTELLAMQVAAIIARFTAQHLACVTALLGGQPDVVTTVPSTRVQSRPGRHPLETAVTRVSRLTALHAPLLVRGPAPVHHNSADEDAFIVSRRLSGKRVLVVDDTLTTGARLQSAASALHRSGAAAVAGIVVGRVINPDWNDNCRRIWDDARAIQFSFDQCCLCRA